MVGAEVAIRWINLYEDLQSPDVDACFQLHLGLHNPSIRRLIPSRAKAQLQLCEHGANTRFEAGEEVTLGLEEAASVYREEAHGMCAIEVVAGFRKDQAAGTEDGEGGRDTTVILVGQIEDGVEVGEVVGVDAQANLAGEIEEAEGLGWLWG